jgi:competence protein ComEC
MMTMTRLRLSLFMLALVLAPASRLSAQSKNLEIYWIDVEGGAATLVVSPSGESTLIDTGYALNDRDPKRILVAAQLAGVRKIDNLVISHFHGDHVGGLPGLAKLIPIGRFYDHGDPPEPANKVGLDSYLAVNGGKRNTVKPGDIIPMKGVEALVIASHDKFIDKPLKGGGPNPLCADAQRMDAVTPENQMGIAVLFTFGKFKFFDPIDMDWHTDMELICPVNKLGTVTVYQTARHGSWDGAASPAFIGAIKPQVMIVNNGPRKGLGQKDPPKETPPPAGKPYAPYEHNSFFRMAHNPGVEDIWQGHLSLLDKDPAHNTNENMIANFEETADCKGNWIKASVSPDGKFTITNGRNGFSKTYTAH